MAIGIIFKKLRLGHDYGMVNSTVYDKMERALVDSFEDCTTVYFRQVNNNNGSKKF